jgi:hypothetical protein
MNTETDVYDKGNLWERTVYRHMTEYISTRVQRFGTTRGNNQYKHWLVKEDAHFNFITPDIYKQTLERFRSHKAGDINRILTNTAASQPFCFNLIIYLQEHLHIANHLFSKLLNKSVIVKHLEPEFTPNQCSSVEGFDRMKDESIGDQEATSGTDADIAVFYNYEQNKKGILLIEFKFIESEFSVCSSHLGPKRKKDETNTEKEERLNKKMTIQSLCNSENFFAELIEKKNSLCGYNKYYNWTLINESDVFDSSKIKALPACPFRFGLNQLWRNMLLAEQVSSARQCDEFGFWVFSSRNNDKYLWKQGKTEKLFRNVLTESGNKKFKKVYIEAIFDELQNIVSDTNDKMWLHEMQKKYRIPLMEIK